MVAALNARLGCGRQAHPLCKVDVPLSIGMQYHLHAVGIATTLVISDHECRKHVVGEPRRCRADGSDLRVVIGCKSHEARQCQNLSARSVDFWL